MCPSTRSIQLISDGIDGIISKSVFATSSNFAFPSSSNSADPELKRDREILLEAIKQNGKALEFANAELKRDQKTAKIMQKTAKKM